MLILRRKAGESLVIGDEIKVTVLDINEGSVRLAIEAPKRITILRSELLLAADANRDAAQEQPQKLLELLDQRERKSGQDHAAPVPAEQNKPAAEEQDTASAQQQALRS